jgi:hypothetical protein
MIKRGRRFVAVRWVGLAVVAVYVSSSIRLTQYAFFLDGLAASTRRLPDRAFLVLMDFNDYAIACSYRTNWRGRVVLDWAVALDLQLINQGSSSTCVVSRGKSILDFTWPNPAAIGRVSEWETLYILVDVAMGGPSRTRSPDARRAGGGASEISEVGLDHSQ